MKTPGTGDVDTCALCPRLCRSACPVASGTGREAAVPAVIAGVIRDWRLGRVDPELARRASTLCTDCGACQRFCHLDRPLPEVLRQVRAELVLLPPVEPIRPIEGEGAWVAVETDERRWSRALARYLGTPVRRWYTADRWGVAAIEHAGWAGQRGALRAASEGLTLVIADGGLAECLQKANLGFRWLHDVCPELRRAVRGCREFSSQPDSQGQPPKEHVGIGCCGAAGPLHVHHPDDARRMGRRWLRDRHLADSIPYTVRDTRCGGHLRDGGAAVRDSVDLFLEIYG
jgi:hypothetical protein